MVHNHPTMTRSSDGSNVKRDQGLAERQVDGGGGGQGAAQDTALLEGRFQLTSHIPRLLVRTGLSKHSSGKTSTIVKQVSLDFCVCVRNRNVEFPAHAFSLPPLFAHPQPHNLILNRWETPRMQNTLWSLHPEDGRKERTHPSAS